MPAPYRILAFIALCLAAAVAHAEPPMANLNTLSTEQLTELLPNLRKGGYVFYFRHATTRQDQEDRQPVVLEDCSTQRGLSDEGRRQAREIGNALRALRIPIGKVWSSPFCRTMETARLAFREAKASQDLYFAIGLAKPERDAKGAALRDMLATMPVSRTNTVLVAHTANLQEATGYWPKPEGTAILFQPDGKGGTRLIGRVPPELWLSLAESR